MGPRTIPYSQPSCSAATAGPTSAAKAAPATQGISTTTTKCVSAKKKRQECHKKSVKKEWIEDLVVSETMKMVMDDTAIEAIVSMLMDLQDRENMNLPLYEQQLREADTAIQNLLNAIQQGILTKSTKGHWRTGNPDSLRETGKAQNQRRVYALLAPPLPQVRRTAEVPQEDVD